MARIRTIKPEFYDSPGIETLEFQWRLLYIAMWNWADDTGRGKAEARELMGFVFPRDEEITVGEFRRGLGEVRRVFGVKFYRHEGRAYYCIPAWDKHQKIDKRSGSKYPGPEQGQELDPVTNALVPAGIAPNSWVSAETPPTPRGNLGAGTGEQGNRGTGEQSSSSDAEASDAGATGDSTAFPEHVYELCDHLARLITRNGNKVGEVGVRWHQAMDRLVRIDGYTPDQITQVIDWSQDNEFWQSNILSASKLREKFDQLKTRMLNERNNRTGGQFMTAAERKLAAGDDLVAKFAALEAQQQMIEG